MDIFFFISGTHHCSYWSKYIAANWTASSIFGTTNGFKTGPAGVGRGGGGSKTFEVTSWPPVGGGGWNSDGPLSIKSSIFGNVGGGPNPLMMSTPPPPGLTLLLKLLVAVRSSKLIESFFNLEFFSWLARERLYKVALGLLFSKIYFS